MLAGTAPFALVAFPVSCFNGDSVSRTAATDVNDAIDMARTLGIGPVGAAP
jgi:hypothetical protein